MSDIAGVHFNSNLQIPMPAENKRCRRDDSKYEFTLKNLTDSDLEGFLGLCIRERYTLNTNFKAFTLFTRFIAPVQIGDQKDPDFVVELSLSL